MAGLVRHFRLIAEILKTLGVLELEKCVVRASEFMQRALQSLCTDNVTHLNDLRK